MLPPNLTLVSTNSILSQKAKRYENSEYKAEEALLTIYFIQLHQAKLLNQICSSLFKSNFDPDFIAIESFNPETPN